MKEKDKKTCVQEALAADLKKLDPGILFPAFRLGVYRMIYRIEGVNRLRGYLGSAWRGVLGHALKKKFCLWVGKNQCEKCGMSSNCIYCHLFEMKWDAPRIANPPRPYMVAPAGAGNNKASFDLTLFGLDDEETLQVLSSLYEVKSVGWAGKKTCVRLVSIYQMQPEGRWKRIFSEDHAAVLARTSWLLKDYLDARQFKPPPWSLKIITPLRLERQKKVLRKVPWGWTFERLAWRLFDHCCQNGMDIKKNVLKEELPVLFNNCGRIIEVNYWRDARRFSSTQNKKIPTGGVKGVGLIMPPEGLERIWHRWWQTAALLHLGKKTTIGNGKIRFNH